MRAGTSGTISKRRGCPPHCSILPCARMLFVSRLRPAGTMPPGVISSLPVGINATRGLRTTATLVTLPPAMCAITSGVTTSPARANTSPTCCVAPAGLVPAKRAEGAASMETCCWSSETATCSITMAVSKPSGIAMPVLANCQFTPRIHVLVSGSPFSKSSQRTAMESMQQVSTLGACVCAKTSRASTRPRAADKLTSSVRASIGPKSHNSKMPSTACWRESSICFE